MSSTQSQSSSQSTASCQDPLDSLIDFTDYDKLSYQSPSVSPTTKKSTIQQDLSGPSHNYAMYRQQTGIPQGAVASTLAINQQINAYNFESEYLSGIEGDFDFGTTPARNGSFNPEDLSMEFGSPSSEPAYFYPESSPPGFVNPSAIGNGIAPTVMPTQTSNVGRLWPGMHQQQAALAKAQAQQKQQQQLIQQQRQNAMSGQKTQRPRASHGPTDPIVEEKISQLLNSMRHSSVETNEDSQTPTGQMTHAQRMRKDEEEMDEDERLLASEEGKKLSSKERRQLRNKVSARAFRSRRKEYISQLEGEIAVKVNENSDLRSQNRALLEENTRLSDLTRMLLSSPSFSGFLDTLASNPAAAQTAQAIQQPQQTEPQRQIRKDINPYAAQQQTHQNVNMAMVPEQPMDFSMLELTTDGAFSYQPQVFSVLSIPEAVIDTNVLSGKGSFAPLASDAEKVELPAVERPPVAEEKVGAPVVLDEKFDSDPAFALYATPTTVSSKPEFDFSFLANLSLKPPTYELVVDDSISDAAMRKVDRLSADLDACVARLRSLTSLL